LKENKPETNRQNKDREEAKNDFLLSGPQTNS
jgi:hypothetical protein